jgi:hypothetical protein
MIDRLALLLVIAGCVLFGTLFAAELNGTPTLETDAIAEGVAQRPAATPRPAPRRPAAQVGATVAEILARPLFSATRRPPARNEGPAEDTSLSDTRLAGIVTEPGRRFAIFAPSGAKPLVVKEGDTVSGWRIETITPRQVSLSGPEGTKTLEPKIDPNLVPPSPPTASALAPPGNPPVRPSGVMSQVRPLPPVFPNRPPLRPGQFRERRQ